MSPKKKKRPSKPKGVKLFLNGINGKIGSTMIMVILEKNIDDKVKV